MRIQALFVIVKKEQQSNYLSERKWLNKLYYVYTIKDYASIKIYN